MGRAGVCFQPFIQWALEQLRVGVPAPSFPQMRIYALTDGAVQGSAVFLVPFSCLVIRLVRVCLLLYTILQ